VNNPNFVYSCTVNISPIDVEHVFASSKHQKEALIKLYKMVVPEWDNIVKMNCFPECNDVTWRLICEKFIEFDRIHHPEVLAGGCWLNHGFGVSTNIMLDWFIYIADTDAISYR